MIEGQASTRAVDSSRKKSPLRVVFLLEVPAPYREPLLDELGALDEVDLTVLFCSKRDPWQEQSGWQEGASRREVLPGLAVGGKRGRPPWKLNPKIWLRLSEAAPDVVMIGGYAHATMQLAMLWCRRNNVPYLLGSESQDRTPRPGWRRLLKVPVVRWAVEGASGFLATGSDAADYLVKYGANREGIFLFPNVPDVRRLSSACEEQRTLKRDTYDSLGVHGNPLFIYVGRLIEAKNVQLLIKAFADVKQKLTTSGLLLLGDGPLRGALQALAERLSLSDVYFVGSVSQRELPKYFAVADCFVLPSRSETWGVVVIEALVCGLPVIVSDRVGCSRDIVTEGGNGFVVQANDETALTQAMIEMGSALTRERMSANAREVAQFWNYGLCIKNLLLGLEYAVARSTQKAFSS